MEVVYLDKPFKIQSFPLDKIYVLDNWATYEILYNMRRLTTRTIWAQNNQVNRNGKIRHLFWGSTFYEGKDKKIRDHTYYEHNTYLIRYLDWKLQSEFGFRWEHFQYAGMNGQTYGLQGTIHEDSIPENKSNISFLWYNTEYWEDDWGGPLRFYNEEAKKVDGFSQDYLKYQIAQVDYKPNRLLMFDGSIPHNADAPNEKCEYACRQSLVIRGDACRLENELDYYANDRI